MSERGSFGPFLLGVAVGAALGALFAPNTGEVTRKQVRRKLRGLRDLAEEKAGDISALVAGDETDEDEDEDEDTEAPAETRSAREELEQRLADARRRRRQGKRARDPEEGEPVA